MQSHRHNHTSRSIDIPSHNEPRLPWACDDCMHSGSDCSQTYPCDKCTDRGITNCNYTPPAIWIKSSCVECRAKHTRCIYSHGRASCDTCETKGKECLYTITNRSTNETAKMRVAAATMTNGDVKQEPLDDEQQSGSRQHIESTCQCNAFFRVQQGTPEQGANICQLSGGMLRFETILDVGEAGASIGLPFPLKQARLRLLDPSNRANMERHVVVEGEPMVTEFHAVESMLNVLRTVPDEWCQAMDMELMMEGVTLRWDSEQLEGQFRDVCSACCLPKDRGLGSGIS